MDTAQHKIELRDPKSLRPHHKNRSIPRLTPGMPQWDQLVDDIAERGVQDPIWITNDSQVVDGETRRTAALAAGIDLIPCRIVEDNQVVTCLVEKLLLQKHFTKGQLAYNLHPLVSHLRGEAALRRSKRNLRIGVGFPDADSIGVGEKSLSELAASWGFSKDLFDQAGELRAIFSGDKVALKRRRLEGVDFERLRSTWEPRIQDMNGQAIGLGAALAGIAGEVSTAGIPKPVNSTTQVDSFERGIQSLSTALDARRWAKTDPDAQRVILVGWRKASATWSPDCRRELAEALLDGLDDDQVEANQDAHTQGLSVSDKAQIAAAAKARWAKFNSGKSSAADPAVSATTTEDPA